MFEVQYIFSMNNFLLVPMIYIFILLKLKHKLLLNNNKNVKIGFF